MSVYQNILAAAFARQKLEYGVFNEGDYYEEVEGSEHPWDILHCKTCHKPKQAIRFIGKRNADETQREMELYAVKHPTLDRDELKKRFLSIMPPANKRRDLGLVGVPCKCQLDYIEGRTRAEKDEQRRRAISNNKNECFPAFKMTLIKFDGYQENKYIKAAQRYVKKWQEMKREGKGLVFCGQTGSGKTIASVCLANALLEREFKVLFKVQQEITFCELSERQRMLSELELVPLLIIDDFNLDGVSDYGKELLFSVIDYRVKALKPTVITTNYSKTAFDNPKQQDKRLLERIASGSYIIEDNSHNYRRNDE